MKKRLLSAIVVICIAIPIFIKGEKIFNLTFFILAILGLKEFLSAREKDKKFPDFMRLISYIMLTLIYFGNVLNTDLSFILDYRLIAALFLTLLTPVVLYHDDNVYNISDAFYLLAFVLFLGFSMSLFNFYRNKGLEVIIFLFLITILTDTYAYFTGRLIGKHKLLEIISPNKTWEGTIGGSLVATFICTMYYFTVINSNESILKIGLIVLFLTLIGQFGDLFFSAIKRKYGIKDFSNIMPGHGGILDRLDSIIFVMLAFTFFMGII